MKKVKLVAIVVLGLYIQLVGCASKSTMSSLPKARLSLDTQLLGQKDQWSKQCDDLKINLFCWLNSKDKVPTLSEALRLPIQQGVTSDRVMQLVITLPKHEGDVLVRLFDRAQNILIEPKLLREVGRSYSTFKNLQVRFEGLSPKKVYEFIVAAKDGEILDEREVSTLPVSMSKLKFAVVSCANDELYEKEGSELWTQLWDSQPQFILEIGDNVYADVRFGKVIKDIREQDIWERYVETRSRLNIYKKHKLIPIFAIWDDHDYGSNDGDRTFVLKDQSLKVFKDFFFQEDVPNFFQNGPSLSSLLRIGGQKFLIMDDRTYRSVNQPSDTFIKNKGAAVYPNKTDNDTYETHFGKEGEAFIDKFLNEDKKPAWLISGDQFFGNYHNYESYEGNHPNSFKNFTNQLKQAKSKVVFLSGDRHISEIMKISERDLAYQTYEITSSPIHSRTDPKSWEKDKNPRQIVGAAGIYNYTLIESEVIKNKMNFKVSTYKNSNTPKDRLLYEKSLQVGK
jgi:hypothetical protein